jgi:hypothetical protein
VTTLTTIESEGNTSLNQVLNLTVVSGIHSLALILRSGDIDMLCLDDENPSVCA